MQGGLMEGKAADEGEKKGERKRSYQWVEVRYCDNLLTVKKQMIVKKMENKDTKLSQFAAESYGLIDLIVI